MNQTTRLSIGLLTVVLGLLIVVPALAQAGDSPSSEPLDELGAHLSAGYDLSWYTIDGGGAACSEGGGYTLGGTIGQPDAGVLTGDRFALGGGFWAGGAATPHRIYVPLVLRGNGP